MTNAPAEGVRPAPGHQPALTRVVVSGSESTGKTTLAMALALTLRSRWVPEYSRSYAESVHRPLTADDVAPIARGQIAAEEAAYASWCAERVPGVTAPPLVLDTDLVSTVVYATHYYGSCPPWLVNAAGDRLGELYLLCAPDLPWQADGVRDQPDARTRVHLAFRERLRFYGARVVIVEGVGPLRLEAAVVGLQST